MDIQTERFTSLTVSKSLARGILFVLQDGQQRHSWRSRLDNMSAENAIVCGCIAIILVTNGHHYWKRLPLSVAMSGSILFQLHHVRESTYVRSASVHFILNSIF